MRYVVIDRPRHHNDWDRNSMVEKRVSNRVYNDPDSLPKKGKMSKGRGTKHLSDHIKPLLRYLDKQVGRPWNKVWSEVSEHCPGDGLMQQHIRGHITDYVELNVKLVDGKPFAYKPYYEGGLRPLGGYHEQLYVCPNSGLLKKAKKARKLKKLYSEDDTSIRVAINKTTQAHKIKGVWYKVKLGVFDRLKTPYPTHCPADCILGSDYGIRDYQYIGKLGTLYGRMYVYGISKQQMSKKDIKKYITKK